MGLVGVLGGDRDGEVQVRAPRAAPRPRTRSHRPELKGKLDGFATTFAHTKPSPGTNLPTSTPTPTIPNFDFGEFLFAAWRGVWVWLWSCGLFLSMVLGVAVLSGRVVLRFVAALRGLLGGALGGVLVVGCVGVGGGSVGGSGDRVGVGGAVPVVGGSGVGVGVGVGGLGVSDFPGIAVGSEGVPGEGVVRGVEEFDKSRAGVVSRSADSTVWEGADGSRLVEVSSGGVLNVLRGGVWRSVSTVVVPRGVLGGGGGVVDHPLSPVFADRADDVRLLGVSVGGFGVGFSVPGAARVLGVVAPGGLGSRVLYPGVFPDTDLVFDVTEVGVDEFFEVAKAPGASGRVEWSWRVVSPGLV